MDPTILNDAGVSFGSNSILSSLPTYVTIFVATLISFPLINRFSRRGLLIASVLGMAFSHLLMATLLAVHAPALTVLIPMMLGAGTFTLGLAPLSWIIVSEIFPNRVRSRRSPSSACSLFGYIIPHGAIVPNGMDWLRRTTGTPALMYVVFAAICVSCAVFTWKVMPETKGVSLEAIGEFWRSRAARRRAQTARGQR